MPSQVKRFSIVESTCHYCPEPATSRDHIVPQQMGGGDGRYNLVPSCEPCNTRKAHEWPACGCEKCDLARWLFLAKSDPLMREKIRDYSATLLRLRRIRDRVRALGPNPLFASNAQQAAKHLDWLELTMRKREALYLQNRDKPRVYQISAPSNLRSSK